MRNALLFALLTTFLVGFVLMATALKEHLRGWGVPTFSSLMQERTPQARQRAKRLFVGLALCCISLIVMLALGPF